MSAFKVTGFLFSQPSGDPSVISVTLYNLLVAIDCPYPRILALSSDIIGSFNQFTASFVTSDLWAAVSANIAMLRLCNGTSAASLLTAANTAV